MENNLNRDGEYCENCKYCREEDEYEYWCYGFCSPARLVRKDDFCSHFMEKHKTIKEEG